MREKNKQDNKGIDKDETNSPIYKEWTPRIIIINPDDIKPSDKEKCKL